MVAQQGVKVFIIPAHPEKKILKRILKNSDDPIPEVREIIGGWAELLYVVGDREFSASRVATSRPTIPWHEIGMLVDEEARLKNPPPLVNMRASILRGFFQTGSLVFGDAVVIGMNHKHGHFNNTPPPFSLSFFDKYFEYMTDKVPGESDYLYPFQQGR